MSVRLLFQGQLQMRIGEASGQTLDNVTSNNRAVLGSFRGLVAESAETQGLTSLQSNVYHVCQGLTIFFQNARMNTYPCFKSLRQ